MIRGLNTEYRERRRIVMKEVAKLGFEGNVEDLNERLEMLPYQLINEDTIPFRHEVSRSRSIVRERIRLALGLPLRPNDRPVPLTSGINPENLYENVYEAPLVQVIPSACNACPPSGYVVTDMCQGCNAHPCMEVCPRGAIEIKTYKSEIDSDKCVKCGKCHDVCPYKAIVKRERPCANACGLGAITTDKHGRAMIDQKKCVSCGQCIVNCPFGAVSDKSQVFQLAGTLASGAEVIAEVAPAYIGQFGQNIGPRNLKAALKQLGFADVVEVALGADIGAVTEAHHYVEKVTTGELPFLLTSCCPSWAMLARRYFPNEKMDQVSTALTPMVATARTIKKKRPDAKIVFIGPCASKKNEMVLTTVRSDVDFVITFEELQGMFDAKDIQLELFEAESSMHDATGAGRGYAVAGGVSKAIGKCLTEYYPDVDYKIEHTEGLANCKRMLMMAKAGKLDGYLIEGMACPGGCIAGAGTNIPLNLAQKQLDQFVKNSSKQLPPKELAEIDLGE
ncbi:MAG: 4Fe-4S dicluster domain-containing protein [Dorea sp.]|nr:4Fe-4S dicluster domain-containing protein [Dorea sp.]